MMPVAGRLCKFGPVIGSDNTLLLIRSTKPATNCAPPLLCMSLEYKRETLESHKCLSLVPQ